MYVCTDSNSLPFELVAFEHTREGQEVAGCVSLILGPNREVTIGLDWDEVLVLVKFLMTLLDKHSDDLGRLASKRN